MLRQDLWRHLANEVIVDKKNMDEILTFGNITAHLVV
jgi:hypothetical protein